LGRFCRHVWRLDTFIQRLVDFAEEKRRNGVGSAVSVASTCGCSRPTSRNCVEVAAQPSRLLVAEGDERSDPTHRPPLDRHLTVKGSRLNELSLEMLGRARPPARRSNGLHGVVRCFTATRQVGRNPSGGGPSMMATYDVSLGSQPTDTYTQRRFELRISTHFKTRTGCQRLSRHTHAFEFSFTGYIK